MVSWPASNILGGTACGLVRNGLSIEITPETADDAYGGWWVSAYNEEALEKVRATQKEIEQITVERTVARQAAAAQRAQRPPTQRPPQR